MSQSEKYADVLAWLIMLQGHKEPRLLCQQKLETHRRSDPDLRSSVDNLYVWASANKLGLYASLMTDKVSQEKADALFEEARGALQSIRANMEWNDARHFADYCLTQAEIADNCGDASAQAMQYEFALNFRKMLGADLFCEKNNREIARLYLQLADAMSRMSDDGIEADRVGMNIRLAIHEIGKLPHYDFKAEDHRFLVECYMMQGHHHQARGHGDHAHGEYQSALAEHKDANDSYENAIKAILDIPPQHRTLEDHQHFQRLHKLAKSEDAKYEGFAKACSNYGLFATTSKVEHSFPIHSLTS